MKHLLIGYTSLCISFALQAMEPHSSQLETIYLTKKTQTSVQTQNMVEYINTILTKKYETIQNTLNFIDTFVDISSITPHTFTEQIATEILTTMTSCYQKGEPTPDCVEQLYTKNVIFKNAIDHFSTIAFKNIQNANCTTLSTIENPALQQASPQLNRLCYALKKCIIDKAMKKIDHSYEMQLVGHNHLIDEFRCNAPHDLVATASSKENTIRVWNLKSAATFLHVPIQNILRHFALTEDGSYLIVCEAMATQPNINHIVGWDLSTKTTAWSLEQAETINRIRSTSNSPEQIIAFFTTAYTDSTRTHNQHLWIIRNNTPHYLASMTNVKAADDSAINYDYRSQTTYHKKYTLKNPMYMIGERSSTLFVIKHNCPAVYLCEQAIKNNKHRASLEQVKNSQAYQQLTEYEKNMIQQKITQKTVELTALKQQQKRDLIPQL
jgi:hypothetical protein